MAIGTAGLTAMLAVMALEAHGLAPGHGPVLVTGAAGGVGSVAVAVLARLGHEVAAVTGRPETEAYLRGSARRGSCRAPISPSRSARPLESETWAGCVDAVGGADAGAGDEAAQVPRGRRRRRQRRRRRRAAEHHPVPAARRQPARHRQRAAALRGPPARPGRGWCATSTSTCSTAMVRPATLAELPALGADILKGRVQGRVVVDVNA